MKHFYSSDEIERQKRIDLKRRELMWDEIAIEAGGGERGRAISDAVRDLYTIYDERLVDWTANLYDKGWGGFYASPIGKDTEGFVPDLESTEQMFSFISGTGMLDDYGRSCKAGLPDWMMRQIMYYAKSIQDENGYFYHPHWSKATADEQISHKSRDLYRCISVLSEMDLSPTYDTPTAEKGDGVTADEYWTSLGCEDSPPPHTYEYNKTKISAKSSGNEQKAKSDGADYLRSHTAFIDYVIDSVIPRMKVNPYSTGNEIGETAKQIKVYSGKLGPYRYKTSDGEKYSRFDGMTLVEISINELNSIINESTGLWGNLTPEKPKGTEFCYVNGFMKAMAAYNLWGCPYPARYLDKVAHALMECLLSDEESPGNICAVYNVWASICRFKQNICLNPDAKSRDHALAIVDGILKDKAPDAIRNTKRKLIKYKKYDGGFGHSYVSGTPSHQGMPVSTGENASDVDATVIGADHLLNYLFDAIGIKKPPILSPSDWMRCKNMLEAAEPVVKTKHQERRRILSRDSKNPFRAAGAKFEYPNTSDGLIIAFMDGKVKLPLTADLYGYESKIFELKAKFDDCVENAEIDAELQSYNGTTVSAFKVFKANDGIYAGIGNETVRLSEENGVFTAKAIYKDSTVTIISKDNKIKASSLVDGYPADGIYTVTLGAAKDIKLTVYSVAFYIGDS